MATRSTEAATEPAATEPAAPGWTEEALLAEARERHVPGTGTRWRWFFSGVWLAYLIQPVSELFDHHSALWIAGGLLITAAFCAVYMPVLMIHNTRPRLAGYGLGVIAVLAAVACAVYGKNWTPLPEHPAAST